MIKAFLFFITFIFGLCFLSCKKENREISQPEKITVDENLSKNDTFKILSKYPELKLFSSEKVENLTRTAHIVQEDGYYESFLYPRRKQYRFFQFSDYKCKTEYKGDTINIWLNNYNGYFGNGVLVKVFNHQFLIQDIDPKALKGEIKFINSYPVYQKLALNKYIFQKSDSIYGFIDYETKLDSLVTKNFRGYFKTKIK
ncbi:hypothetical protein [Chryseobacterium gambrini]|uniref:Uncharacterized protein n=1 Tax=Chryseobacterium gambrini TaxID=373672 RepID=A0A1N7PUJ2_9FLAO|nr:hypothetical protein [Chryseobacterium gambrini]SIT14278.1 hypothetical protein SAMN05421785_107217 [Chryseobacterium gambrini]